MISLLSILLYLVAKAKADKIFTLGEFLRYALDGKLNPGQIPIIYGLNVSRKRAREINIV
ncbi:hypothetical protein AT705_10480 [Pseudoalteromonas rubra]|uniref:Uncharacterized protein n=1 Tax=Pseudoalteromonas rubra TaxID=43658 RepID=A0A0L0EMB4_9GAMM|nr:hypothetical protein AT705_10480 [Pseudoalteromonas rubra]KNC65526.1 hypothetical protein AC626_22590 [Pseudoalteromonas rubra]